MAFKARFPFCAMVSGATQAGKTHWMKKFLQHLDELIDAEITEVIWCYGISQKSNHDDIKAICPVPITFVEGLPDIDEITTPTSPPKLVVLDDLQNQCKKGEANDLFSRAASHRQLGIFHLVQNFHGKGMRDLSLQVKYAIIFKNPREASQIAYLARQMAPGNWRYIIDAYNDATAQPHGYLLFDLAQQTPSDRRVRTHIFPGEQQVAYAPK
jgi:hypothetical protein